MTKENNNPLFTFDTTNPTIVTLSLSPEGREIAGENSSHIFDDLVENLDQSLRNAGYMYNIQANMADEQISIKPFENIEPFNQEVFDIIAEELLFTDNLLRGDEDGDMEDEDEE